MSVPRTERRLAPFTHLGVPHAGLYRAVLGCFAKAKACFVVHLRPEDLVRELGRPVEEVRPALDALVDWGNLRADPDTSRVATVEDFYRARFLFQLTAEGEAVERALEEFDRVLGRPAELQSVALEDLRAGLLALALEADQEAPDAARVHALLRDLTTVFTGLAENAQAFMGGLQRTIDLRDADDEAFLAYKERLVAYLERFVRELVVASGDIAARLVDLERTGAVGRLLKCAAERSARDASPELDGGHAARSAFEEDWSARWRGLRSWFLGEPGSPPQATRLRARAGAAIAELLIALAARHERRSTRSDRVADFRDLAAWFMEAPSDDAAHRLWRAAFGLAPARHLTIDAETLARPDRKHLPASTPWADAPPVHLNPRLRATGSHARRGAPAQVRDRTRERELLARMLSAESGQVDAARERLATGRSIKLSEIGLLGELDTPSFQLFLDLLGQALSARAPGAAETAITTGDARLEVVLTALPDGGVAEIPTTTGLFRGPDHLLRIIDLESVHGPAAASGAAESAEVVVGGMS